MVHNPWKELNPDALLTDSPRYVRRFSIQRNNVLHQSPPNNRQPKPIHITQRKQSKKNVRVPFWKSKKRNSNQRNNVATSRPNRQLLERVFEHKSDGETE